MSDYAYFGTYARYDTASKGDAAVLLGADSVVGDLFEIEFVVEEGVRVAWIKNRFDARVGYFDAETSHRLSLCAARGWNSVAILSFVAFTEQPSPGHYWGEVALIAYDPKNKTLFVPFIERIAERIAQGVRVEVALQQKALDQLAAAPATWLPAGRAALPPRVPGTAILKSHRKLSEGLIECGRKGNIGCYVVSWAFILGFVALSIFGLKSCGVF
ncbi:MAG: hypothetical protein RRX94_00240 [Raoultibacter sp.]